MKRPSVAVVGGGAAGIAAAHYLCRAGFGVEMIESSSGLGGRMATARLGARSVALGGKNIGRRYELFREFVHEMGDPSFEYFGLNSSRIRNGRVVTFDGERRWSGLLRVLRACTFRDIARLVPMIAATRRDRRNGFLSGPLFGSMGERRTNNLASYFSARFCDEFVRPLSVRMNGAEPSEIALGNFGTNLSMIFDTYDQLREGLDPVFEHFARTVTLRLGTRVEALIVRGGRVGGVRTRNSNGIVDDLEYDHVVLATPACVAANLVRPHEPELAELLRSVRYFPVAVVVAEYDRPIFGKDVRAIVFPSNNALSNAGVYGVEDRHIVRYTFSGAAARELLAKAPSIDCLLDLGERTLTSFVSVRREERLSFAGKLMPIGLCAYAWDHEQFAAGVGHRLSRLSGLDLTGDYVRGASIEGCFRAGRDCADRLCAASPEDPS